jgi:plastocyanin
MSTRMMRFGGWAVLLGAATAAASCFSERGPTEPPAGLTDCALPLQAVARGDAIVLIRGQAFLPDTVHARPGQRVTWVNCEPEGADAHTSTAVGGAWESPLLQRAAFFTHEFGAAGEFAYTCLPHPHMRGAVIVE